MSIKQPDEDRQLNSGDKPIFKMSIWLRGIAIFCLTTFHLDNAFGFALKRNIPRSSHLIQRASSISDEPQLRIGHGFDIHRLIEGTKLIIGLLQYGSGIVT